jgi:hypothetical protein
MMTGTPAITKKENAKPFLLTSGIAIVLYVALARIILYLVAGPHYGYFRDELYTGESLIVLGEGRERNMQTKCASYSIVGNTETPLSRPDEWLPIYHCRGFKWNLQTSWQEFKHWR